MKKIIIDESWTLFLDRDGVINKHIVGDYIKSIDDFEFLTGSLDAIAKLSKLFKRVFIITNQRGLGKNLFSHKDLEEIHNHMVVKIKKVGGRIDKIYYCPDIEEDSYFRKPNPGMLFKAKEEFSQIEFNKSFMVGDSNADMKLGKSMGMVCIYIKGNHIVPKESYDMKFDSLYEFSNFINKTN